MFSGTTFLQAFVHVVREKETPTPKGLGYYSWFAPTLGRTEVSFPERTGLVTDAHCVNLPGDRSKTATETGSDINLGRDLDRLQSAIQPHVLPT